MTKALIIEARFYDEIADKLLDAATSVLTEAGATYDVITVPGALEIPAALQWSLDKDYDAYILLGCVIKGETIHDEIVANECFRLVSELVLANDLALGNGVLTVNTIEQALSRSDKNDKDRGGAAARAALHMLALRGILHG